MRRRSHLGGRLQPRLAENRSDLRPRLGISREHPYELCAQPLEIGRQKNVGNGGAGMWHELPGKLRDESEIFVQTTGEGRGGLGVAGINGGEE